MNKYQNQSEHNKILLDELKKKYPSCYFDWKITILFYITIHEIRSFALSKRGIELEPSHRAIFDFLETETSRTSKIYKSFNILYRNCRDVRYNGFTTIENFEKFCEIKFNESQTHFGYIKAYIESQNSKSIEIEESA